MGHSSLKRQLISFGLIGIINTGVDLGGFALLAAHGVPAWLATIVSGSIGLAVSLTLNSRLTFGSDISHSTVWKFLAVTLCGLWLLQPASLWAWTAITSHDYIMVLSGKLIATGVTALWNFAWYRSSVFAPIQHSRRTMANGQPAAVGND